VAVDILLYLCQFHKFVIIETQTSTLILKCVIFLTGFARKCKKLEEKRLQLFSNKCQVNIGMYHGVCPIKSSISSTAGFKQQKFIA